MGATGCNGRNLLQQFDQTLLFEGRNKENGQVVEGGRLGQEFIPGAVHGFVVLGDQVPLVHRQDDAFLVFLGQVKDAKVLGLQAIAGVHQQNHDIAVFQGTQCSHDRIKFNIFLHPGFAPQTRGVHHQEMMPKGFELRMNDIPGCSRDFRNDASLLPHQGIEQGGFAHVGSADQGNLGDGCFFGLGLGGRQSLHHLVQQFPGARARLR